MKSLQKVNMKKLTMLILLLVALPFMVQAQGFLMENEPSDKTVIGFRFFHPNFNSDVFESVSFFSGIYDVSLHLPIGNNMNLVGSLPMLSISGDGLESQRAFGNVYAGVVFKSNSATAGNFSFALGAYIPTLSKEKSLFISAGSFIDYLQLPRYIPDILTINGNLAYHSTSSSGLLFGAEIGMWYSVFTKKANKPDYMDNSEIFVHYGAMIGYRAGNFDLTAEGVGVGHVTEKYEKFKDRLVNELVLGVHVNLAGFRPGVFYKIYIENELKDIVRNVLGFSLDILL